MSVGVNGTGQPDPEQATQKVLSHPPGAVQTIEVEVGTIHWDRAGVFSDKNGYSIRYRDAEHGGGDMLDLNLPGRMIKIPAAEVIKVATDMQNKLRQAPEDVADVDHQTLLADLLKHNDDDDGTVQVLEGGVDDVKPEHFSGDTTTSILEMIHFIQANNLQDQRPWCVIWNLYRCMMVAAGRA